MKKRKIIIKYKMNKDNLNQQYFYIFYLFQKNLKRNKKKNKSKKNL